MKLWVPGSKGLLGSSLVKKVPALGTGREVDIADLGTVERYVKDNQITHIVNCAAYSLVDPAEKEREEAFRANVLGPENLARVAAELKIKLVHISTDYVFPGDGRLPLLETDRTGPVNYYGETKLKGEERVFSCFPEACVIRTSWLFGLGGKNFVSNLLRGFLEKKEILLTDDHWGRPTYAPDLVDAILQLLDHKGLYHFANKGIATKYEFGRQMWQEAIELGFPVAAESVLAVCGSTFPSPCKRPVYSAFDTTKIERSLNLTIRSWKEALREFLCVHLPVCL